MFRTAHNDLVDVVSEIPVVTTLSQLENDIGYLLSEELKVASEENFGVIKIWVEDDYLCISTVAFDNEEENNELTIEGVYDLSNTVSVAGTSLII